MNPVAYATDFLACMALGTVKNLIKICGSPAVPNIKARPKETAEIGSETKPPGDKIVIPFL